MDKRCKRISIFHDRTTTNSSYSSRYHQQQFTRQNSKTSIIQRLPLFVTMDQYEKLQKKIEILENEAIRHNKVLNMYIERIEELENVVKRLEENGNKKEKRENHEKPEELLQNNSELNSSSSSMLKSATLPNLNESRIVITTAASTQNYRQSLMMPSSKEKKRTPKRLAQFSDSNIADGSVSGGFWTRFTQFFKHRPSVEALKEQNIYHNEPCFDTELENVVKHEDYPTIPKIIVECVNLIELKAKKKPTEGLYRMSGDHVEIQKIRFLIDGNNYDCLNNINDIHTIVGVLKLFLREIKDPLVNISEIKVFIGSPRNWTLAPIKTKIQVLQKLMKSLPEQNRDTLQYVLKHLHRLICMPLQFVNARSLAVSLTPTIFHFTISNNADIHTTMKENEALTSCLEIMIEYEDKIFDFTAQNEFRQSVV